MELEVEILSPGKWNGKVITSEIMLRMVKNFAYFKTLFNVPLKFGHNSKQQMTDGEPALGWVDSIWINGAGVMMAKLIDLPKIVHKAIEKKLYKHVSIEASLEVEYKGKSYGAVLTGLGLLGADIPAVNTLNDLQTYLSMKDDVTFSNSFIATRENTLLNKGVSNMGKTVEELEIELAALKAKNVIADADAIKLKAEDEATSTVLKKENTALKDAQDKVAFTTAKAETEATLEALVKAKQITPAQRDKFAEQLVDAVAIKTLKLTLDVLSAGVTTKGLNETTQGLEKTKGDLEDEGRNPDVIVFAKAKSFSLTHKVGFNDAVQSVLLENPDLAIKYRDQFDKVEAA